MSNQIIPKFTNTITGRSPEVAKMFHKLSKNFHALSAPTTTPTISTKIKVIMPKKRRAILSNPIFISIVIFLYIIPNPFIMTYLTTKSSIEIDIKSSSHNNQSQQTKIERTLIGLVGAVPSPEPAAAARTKSSSSGAHRVPPINGSIFGKRSLNNKLKRRGEDELIFRSDQLVNRVAYQADNDKLTQRSASSVELSNSFDRYKAKSEAIRYEDVITDIIEDFLALNNDGK